MTPAETPMRDMIAKLIADWERSRESLNVRPDQKSAFFDRAATALSAPPAEPSPEGKGRDPGGFGPVAEAFRKGAMAALGCEWWEDADDFFSLVAAAYERGEPFPATMPKRRLVAKGVEWRELSSRLRHGLAEMAAKCSVDMTLWGLFSNDVLKAADALAKAQRLAVIVPAQKVEGERAELAALIVQFYEGEIGRLMQQAEHWAANGKPLAVAHRLAKADAYFQIVARFQHHMSNGWGDAFEDMKRGIDTGQIKPLGTYPPSAELHRYSDPRFVVAELDRLAASPLDEKGVEQ